MMSPLFQAWEVLENEYDENIATAYEKFENGGYAGNINQFNEDIREIGRNYLNKRHEVRDRFRQIELLA